MDIGCDSSGGKDVSVTRVMQARILYQLGLSMFDISFSQKENKRERLSER